MRLVSESVPASVEMYNGAGKGPYHALHGLDLSQHPSEQVIERAALNPGDHVVGAGDVVDGDDPADRPYLP